MGRLEGRDEAVQREMEISIVFRCYRWYPYSHTSSPRKPLSLHQWKILSQYIDAGTGGFKVFIQRCRHWLARQCPWCWVLSNSELHNRGYNGQLFDPSMKESVLGVDIAPLILGDPTYPLMDWLIKLSRKPKDTHLSREFQLPAQQNSYDCGRHLR